MPPCPNGPGNHSIIICTGASRRAAQEARRRCPGCDASWHSPATPHGMFDFRCDRCRLLSNLAFNLGAGYMMADPDNFSDPVAPCPP
ncbi:DUF2310 family Zn-ribbon-containing protein [Massilia violaceinigra]|uniref:DUF2310 family Zn-ribbon-containing protein n=1 Tax=Massilia violaceinigra TaxID=2045208 RepID=UPI0012FD45CC